MSCSLVNQNQGGTFNLGSSQYRDAGGVVLAPWTEISCAYEGDGGTADAQMCCGGCDWSRAYPPSNLQTMMEHHLAHNPRGYNEVVVSSQYWVDHLPEIVQAFIPGRGHNDMSWAHEAFLAHYGLTAEQVPMLGIG